MLSSQLRHVTDPTVISLQSVSRYCDNYDFKLCEETLFLIHPKVRYDALSSFLMQKRPIVVNRQITEFYSNVINKASVEKQCLMRDGEWMNVDNKIPWESSQF